MHLSSTYDPQNIFAKILRGEMPCLKVYEDAVCLAFLDIFPQGPGHTLVIPKVAATNLLTLPADALGPYMVSVQKVAKAVQKAFEADGLTVFQFNGAAGGQTVFHLHFHIIPRQEGVGLQGHGQAGKASEEDLIAQQAAIIAAF
ncbi:MAG: HIT family protein [Hyphomonadaceae bacterium]|jgi:histidine triad (HIT) family protein|uniref:HIT family protein n=1 Tax=Aquidulcibacter sp. TaxID=2052990 RepID=UPI0022BE6C37|nr:HIT family protein [Aquidulcibacter sp.]MCE2892366.1 HIT family protein [Hyphomonadaceae bacterium]MCZ8207611.1 HIT family protein [Aquidulcibacter sp.]